MNILHRSYGDHFEADELISATLVRQILDGMRMTDSEWDFVLEDLPTYHEYINSVRGIVKCF